jgi:cholesterol transport system auxiliary component
MIVRAAMRALPLLLGLSLLPGCFSGLNSKLPPEQRYLLTGEIASSPSPQPRTGSVQVLRPSASQGLESARIAVLRPGAHFDYYANVRWAEDAPSALQTLIIDALRTGGHFASVESDSEPFAAQYLLSVEIASFQAEYGDSGAAPTVHVTLNCALGRRSDRSVITSFAAQGVAQARADRMEAVVAAFGTATAQALQQIAENLAPPPDAGARP